MRLEQAREYLSQVAELVKSTSNHQDRRDFLRAMRSDWQYVEARALTVEARQQTLLQRRIQKRMSELLAIDERLNFERFSSINGVTNRNEQPDYFTLSEYNRMSPYDRLRRYSLYPKGELYLVDEYSISESIGHSIYTHPVVVFGLIPDDGRKPVFFDFRQFDDSYNPGSYSLRRRIPTQSIT